MIRHDETSDVELRNKIRRKGILLGGNRRLKIYGTLRSSSGRRMKKENRVFFATEEEALQNNYRPCGHCMKEQYKKWKNEFIQRYNR